MALAFLFSLESSQDSRVTGYDLGHILVRGDTGEFGSDERTPNQAFMLYLSLSHLMSGVSALSRASSGSAFVFEGVDSPFAMEFKYVGRHSIQVSGGRLDVGVVTTRELLAALQKGVDELTTSSPLPPDDPAFEDFVAAKQALVEAIGQQARASE